MELHCEQSLIHRKQRDELCIYINPEGENPLSQPVRLTAPLAREALGAPVPARKTCIRGGRYENHTYDR